MRFTDKIVVVTGGGSGIGKAAAEAFAAEGAWIAINDVNADAAESARLAIERRGGRAIAVVGDVSDESSVLANARAVIEQFGRIDVLISNAGLSIAARAEDYVGWERSIGVNLSGHFYWARAAARESMIGRRAGAIVFTSSGAGLAGVPNNVAYVAAKHALVGLAKALAVEWAEFGIRANCVAPGLIETEMLAEWRKTSTDAATQVNRIPLQRVGQTHDVARLMMFLASDDAAFITGSTFPVDGGQQALHSGMPARR